jgi:hypothetical protein
MKLLSTILLSGMMVVTTAACAKEESKPTAPAKPAVVAPAPAPTPAATAPAAAEKEGPKTKRVCNDKRTNDGKTVMGKDGKPVQECKTIKIHKKAEQVTSGVDPNSKEKKK